MSKNHYGHNKSDSSVIDTYMGWKLIFDAIPDPTAIIGADFTIKNVNKAMCKFLNMEPDDIMGRKCYCLIHEENEPLAICPHRSMLRDLKPHVEHIHEDRLDKDLIVSVSPIFDDGELKGSVHIIRDDTRRTKLEEINERLASIVNNSNDAIIGKDLQGNINSWNSGAEKIYGYSARDVIGKNISLLIPSDYVNDFPMIMEKIKRNEAIDNYETIRINKNGERINVSLTISPITDHSGEIIGASSIARDITEISRAKSALKKSERKYRTIFENVQDVFYQTNLEGIIMEISPSILRYSGFTREELIGKPVEMVYSNPEDRKKLQETISKKGEIVDYEVKLKTKDNKLVYASTNAHVWFDEDNNPIGIEGSLRDVTERKNMEMELRELLNEKEMLLKEIHHRVKNNLMIISSLLDLQSQYIRDKDDLKLFRESQSRANSMALIHERLYRSSDLKHINFGDYIQNLTKSLYHTYVLDANRVKLELEVKDIMLDINTTIPLGLIVNELITNSMKHGFPDGKSGEIRIEFFKKGDDLFLEVQDNGVGIPHQLDFRKTKSLGLQLVNSLTKQIDGEISLDRENGTKFTIKFKETQFNK